MTTEDKIANLKTKQLSISEYANEIEKTGNRIIRGAAGTFWAEYEKVTMMRIPTFYLMPPDSEEIRRIFWKGWAIVASYTLEPDEQHVPNAWLYVCTDPEYSLDKLTPETRRNVRRGLKELRIAEVAIEELLIHGVQAFCDTRQRVGLSDGTREEFKKRFISRATCAGHVFLGAWKDNKLAAFLSITEVDDWAEIEGCFSMNALLRLRPNDFLIYNALYHYLIERKCRIVSYGLSSVQAESNVAGLHVFKTKIGFIAKPVYRAFVFHPLLRPFANQLSLWLINAVLHFRSGNRLLKKAAGMLEVILGKKAIIETQEKET